MRFDNGPTHNLTDAVIYCRVSSKAQTKRGDGLNSQETRCRQYAKYKGYSVARVFRDDLTGRKAVRPGLDKLLSYLRSDRKKPHVVIIDDVSRFARKVRVHFDLRDEITAAGGILESPTMEFRDDADSEFNEYIQATAAQYQARKNAEITRQRMEARCIKGYWPFQPPIGLKHVKIEGISGMSLVRNEPLASIIQEGLEGYASGRFDTQAEVKRFFESQPDFPKDLPGGKIRNQRVNDILRRVIYAGYIEVPNWDVSLREGRHEGLITLATHRKIQDRLKGNAKSPARKDINVEFPLRGFVACGDCSKPLTSCWSTSSTGKKHAYYFCFNRECESHRKSIPRDKLEGEFEATLKQLRPSASLFRLVRAMFKDAWDQRLAQANETMKSLRRDMLAIDKQIEQLVNRIIDSQSDTAVTAYERRIAKLEKDKLLAEEMLSSGMTPKHSFEQMFERAFAFLSNPWKLWASERIEDKKTVLKLAFAERLPYHRNEGFRTPKTTLPFNVLEGICMGKCEMARRGGFEPPTPRFVVWCSIQLSYRRLWVCRGGRGCV